MKLVFSLSVPREEKVFLIDMLFNQLEVDWCNQASRAVDSRLFTPVSLPNGSCLI